MYPLSSAAACFTLCILQLVPYGGSHMTGYRTTKQANGHLVVHGVPIMSCLGAAERPEVGQDIDQAWLASAVETFKMLKGKGKRPLVFRGHNTKQKAATVIGHWDNIALSQLDGEPWITGDMILTDAEDIAKFERGGYPSKSAEFQPKMKYLRGVALLDGHEGHFDYSVPDLVPQGVYADLGLETSDLVLCHSVSPIVKEKTMTHEELLAAIQAANKPLVDKIDALSKEVDSVKLGKSADTDVNAALDQVRAEEAAKAEVKLAKERHNAKVGMYTAQLSAKTKTPATLVRKKLESFKSDEAMDVYFEHAIKQAEEEVKLGIEQEHGDAPDLRAEYEAFKENYPDCKQTYSDYVRLSKSLEPVALAARSERHTVRNAVALSDKDFVTAEA